jgi:hypothetical protein
MRDGHLHGRRGRWFVELNRPTGSAACERYVSLLRGKTATIPIMAGRSHRYRYPRPPAPGAVRVSAFRARSLISLWTCPEQPAQRLGCRVIAVATSTGTIRKSLAVARDLGTIRRRSSRVT